MNDKQRTGIIILIASVIMLGVTVLLPGQLAAQTSDVQGFVTRFYQQCLGREPDAAGLSYWVGSLNAGAGSGEDLAWSFIFSDEFQNSGTTDGEYLNVLYRAFFNREPDQDGYNHWLGLMTGGMDRASVLEGFTSAGEFLDLCESYGILAVPSASEDMTVEGFVTRFYQQCLGREPDAAGLSYWAGSLNAGTGSGEDLAWSFIFSDEFQNSGTTDGEYLNVLYRAFFNREPDQDGYNHWLSLMAGGTDRAAVLDGFTNAQEFITLCGNYGIEPSSPDTGSDSSSSSSSFFPLTVDAVDTIQWKYRINNGRPLNVSYEGGDLSMQFSGINLSVNNGDMVRRGSFSGSVSGDARGSFTANFTETISQSGNEAVFTGQTIEMDMNLSADGESADVELYAETRLNNSLEWFLARPDLDQMAFGVYDQTGDVTGTLSGHARVSGGGYSESIPFSEYVRSVDTWEIVDKLESYSVNGVIYSNVVVVNRYTSLPLGTYSGYQESVTIKYWLAKGIGMIKGVGQYQILGDPLEIELISTNLTQYR